MSNFINKSFKVGYLNLRAQTGFGTTKQAQVEHFVKQHMFDILHLQEAQILEDSFETCDFVTSNYTILTNNARNPWHCQSGCDQFRTREYKIRYKGKGNCF